MTKPSSVSLVTTSHIQTKTHQWKWHTGTHSHLKMCCWQSGRHKYFGRRTPLSWWSTIVCAAQRELSSQLCCVHCTHELSKICDHHRTHTHTHGHENAIEIPHRKREPDRRVRATDTHVRTPKSVSVVRAGRGLTVCVCSPIAATGCFCFWRLGVRCLVGFFSVPHIELHTAQVHTQCLKNTHTHIELISNTVPRTLTLWILFWMARVYCVSVCARARLSVGMCVHTERSSNSGCVWSVIITNIILYECVNGVYRSR